MPFPQARSSASSYGSSPRILHPDPRWFLTRGIALGIVLPVFLALLGAGRLGLLLAVACAIVWLLFRNSSITLDNEGFTYSSVARRISHRWVDVESFSVVEHRVYGFIPVNRFLGWNYTPAYKNYKLLAIPRTLARFVGMTHAMVQPVGFNVRELTSVMNQHLQQTRAAGLTNTTQTRW